MNFNPNSTASWYFLAETLMDMNRRADARVELQKVLDAPIDPEWGPEDQEFKQKARASGEDRPAAIAWPTGA